MSINGEGHSLILFIESFDSISACNLLEDEVRFGYLGTVFYF